MIGYVLFLWKCFNDNLVFRIMNLKDFGNEDRKIMLVYKKEIVFSGCMRF